MHALACLLVVQVILNDRMESQEGSTVTLKSGKTLTADLVITTVGATVRLLLPLMGTLTYGCCLYSLPQRRGYGEASSVVSPTGVALPVPAHAQCTRQTPIHHTVHRRGTAAGG